MQKRFYTSNCEVYRRLLQDEIKKLVIAVGPAGTGKTMLACEEAIINLKKNLIKKIVITRPIIGADNDIGYLPGTIEDKMTPWTRPIFDVFYEHYPKTKILQFIKNDQIEISPLIYMRGRTFKNSFIIGDEMQNANVNQMKMLLTRIGENSKMIINGDLEQVDLQKNVSGLEHFLNLIRTKNDEQIGLVIMNKDDVKRSDIVKKILSLYNNQL